MEEMTRMEKAYLIIDLIQEGKDFNEILDYCLMYFPDLDWDNRGDTSLRQFILDEIINKEIE